jgi:hypothetical protein
MQVFTKFVRTDLIEDQLLIMHELLPVLMSVLRTNEVSLLYLGASFGTKHAYMRF